MSTNFIPDAKGVFVETKLYTRHNCIGFANGFANGLINSASDCINEATVKWITRKAFGIEGIDFKISYYCENCASDTILIQETIDSTGCNKKRMY